jgi:uncharacterized membrane protein (DUF2068 family)
MDSDQATRKPDLVTAIAVMTLISGILNLLWSFGMFVGAVVLGLGTFFVGCICLPFGLYPLALGVAEIVYASRLLRHPPAPNVKPSYAIAVLEIIDMLAGNALALVTGVMALIFYNDPSVRRFFGET